MIENVLLDCHYCIWCGSDVKIQIVLLSLLFFIALPAGWRIGMYPDTLNTAIWRRMRYTGRQRF